MSEQPDDWRTTVLRTVTTATAPPDLSPRSAATHDAAPTVARRLPPPRPSASAPPAPVSRGGLVRRLLRGGMGADRFAAEYGPALAALERPVPTGRLIAVVSPTGGAGRSTLAAACAAITARARGDEVLVADLAAGPSPLPLRLGVPAAPVATVDHALAGSPTAGRVLRDVPRIPGERLRVLADAEGGRPLEASHVSTLLRALTATTAVSWLDCPAGLDDPLTTAVLSRAHAAVVVTRPTPFGVQQAEEAIRRLAASGLPTLAVLNVGATTAGGLDRSAARRLGALVPTHGLPADRHLAGDGRLGATTGSDDTRLALARIAAIALGLALPGPA